MKLQANEKTYGFLLDTKKRINVLYGSAGSGKSWSVAMFLLLELMCKSQNVRVLVTMKTRPALKKACWKLFSDLILKAQIPCVRNLSDLTISIGSNEMYFVPLDDPEKLKSFEKINYIWAEEATSLSLKEYLQLGMRCRGENETGTNQLFFSFNPINERSFWKDITDNPPANTAVNHSTYQDNRFNDPEYIKQLEALIKQDETYHKIYALGMWATPENLIYTNWKTIEKLPDNYEDRIWGLDFGYSTSPAALIEIRKRGDELYEREHLYEKGLTNPVLIYTLKEIIRNKSDLLIADSNEPKTIQEIRNAGLNIHECKKGPDSVRYGISSVKSHKCFITKDSYFLIKEKQGYAWKLDKDGEVFMNARGHPEPVKLHDHLLDAERYAVSHLTATVKAGVEFTGDPLLPKKTIQDQGEKELIFNDELWN